MRLTRRLAPLVLVALVAACADKDKAKPAELIEFRSTADLQRVWSVNLGGNEPRLRLGLGVDVEGEVIYVASYGGAVLALNRDDGRRIWRVDSRLNLSGGPGVGDGLVVVGSANGDILALDAATGEERWKTRVNSEILSSPDVGGGMVVLRTGDGRLVALRARDGQQEWAVEQEVPRLSLRGTGRPLVSGGLAVAGFDNGRVVATQLVDGFTVWENIVAQPAGRTELDRLVDIDTAIVDSGSELYVVTYQGKAARVDRDTGTPLWSRDVSSYSGLTIDEGGVYVSTADGDLVKLDRRTGVEIWKQSVLVRRRLSPPGLLGNLVAVADFEGYVHFFDRETGEPAARLRPVQARVSAPPVVSGDKLVVMDAEGRIAAVRIRAEGESASGTIVRGAAQGGGGGGSGGGKGGTGTSRTDSPTGFSTRKRPGT